MQPTKFLLTHPLPARPCLLRHLRLPVPLSLLLSISFCPSSNSSSIPISLAQRFGNLKKKNNVPLTSCCHLLKFSLALYRSSPWHSPMTWFALFCSSAPHPDSCEPCLKLNLRKELLNGPCPMSRHTPPGAQPSVSLNDTLWLLTSTPRAISPWLPCAPPALTFSRFSNSEDPVRGPPKFDLGALVFDPLQVCASRQHG
ncbi:hypothetical protein Zmor_001714 [Zophobas morio]|uniref:Uncharacterized protein n=1 Tax=Zophobas morio TaxID=2755281 RepID=A0AA38MT20_9CUCU|nr:hypothetical protein Zmor_001714 [Zophobas morio]